MEWLWTTTESRALIESYIYAQSRMEP